MFLLIWPFSLSQVRKDFPVGRELKRIQLINPCRTIIYRPKGLSRWKGIETVSVEHIDLGVSGPKGLSRWKGIET